jgi:hypothetical protein
VDEIQETTAMAKKKRSADERKPPAKGSDPSPRFIPFEEEALPEPRGLGPEAGGQSGDTTGLSQAELSGPESVEELVEEGQAFEAGVISGVEDAPDADQGEVRTRQVPEDDVPQEYLDED